MLKLLLVIYFLSDPYKKLRSTGRRTNPLGLKSTFTWNWFVLDLFRFSSEHLLFEISRLEWKILFYLYFMQVYCIYTHYINKCIYIFITLYRTCVGRQMYGYVMFVHVHNNAAILHTEYHCVMIGEWRFVYE